MKKTNDFDFLQDTINASLDAPESVDRDFVLGALEGEKAQKTNIIPLKKKSTAKKALPTLVAAIAIVLIAALGFGMLPNLHKVNIIDNGGKAQKEALVAYTDYKTLKKDIKELQPKESIFKRFYLYGSKSADYVEEADSATAVPNTSATGTESGAAYGETFTQVAGVDEDDIIKTNGKYIFYAGYQFNYGSIDYVFEKNSLAYDTNALQVYVFLAEGKQSKLITSINLGDEDDREINGIYLQGDTLIAIVSDDEKTRVETFDISDIENIKKTADFAQSGYFSASRLIGEKLFVVTNQHSYENDIPYVCCGDEKQELPANKIYKTEKPAEASFLVVSQIDIHTSEKIEEAKAVLGGSSNVYCNEEHMYVMANIWGDDDTQDDYHERSQIFKIDIADGIRFAASATINGSAKNQYALDETDGVFRVAVTDVNKDYENVNRLYTFDGDLNKLGKLDDFAKGEHIEAVKFIGDTAYVITYETTDPLFIIDLKDAANPRITGEVKIDGFSTTLIPVGDDKLLGIGTDADNSDTGIQSLKLVLFDISDRNHPKIADEKICKHITSDAMYQTKAILRGSDNGTFTLYTTIYTDVTRKYDSDGDYYYYDFDEAYGSLTFHANGGKIVTDTPYTSGKLTSAIGRCTFIGNTIYMVDDAQHIDCTNY